MAITLTELISYLLLILHEDTCQDTLLALHIQSTRVGQVMCLSQQEFTWKARDIIDFITYCVRINGT